MGHRDEADRQRPQVPREMELARHAKLDGDIDVSPDELRQLIDLSPDLVAITRYDGHFGLLNMAWDTALGHSREELRSKSCMEFVHPDDREKTLNMVQRVLPGVPLFSFQNRYVCKDGSYIPIQWRGFSSAQAQRIYTVARDVTKQQQADEQRNVLDAICEQSRDAIVMASLDGVVTDWAGAGERLFGYARSDLVGKPIMHFLSCENGQPSNLVDLPEPPKGADRTRAFFLHRTGMRIAVLVAASPVGNADIPVTGVVATMSLA